MDSFLVSLESEKLIFNFDMKGCQKLLKENDFQKHPYLSMCYSFIFFIRCMISEEAGEIKQTFALFEDIGRLGARWMTSTHAREVQQRAAPDDVQLRVLLDRQWGEVSIAESSFLDSMLKFKLGRYVKGVLTFRKAWKTYEACERRLQEEMRRGRLPAEHGEVQALLGIARFGVGCFHYLVSVVPRAFLWLVEGIGFKGDPQLAVRELEECALGVSPRSTCAKLVLIGLHSFFLGNEAQAFAIYEDVLEAFPQSPVFQYFGGYLYRKKGVLEESERLFGAVQLAAGGLGFSPLELFAVYELGYLKMLQGDWISARELLSRFCDESKASGYKAFAFFLLGVSQSMLFEADSALAAFAKCLKHVRKGYPFDDYAARHARHYLDQKGLSDFEKKYTQATMAYECKDYKETKRHLRAALPLTEDASDERLACDYLMAEIYKERKKRKRAEQLYFSLLETHAPEFSTAAPPSSAAVKKKKKATQSTYAHCLPGALVSLGEIYVMENQDDKAVRYLNLAKQFKDYDFENWNALRIRRAFGIIQAPNDSSPGSAESPEPIEKDGYEEDVEDIEDEEEEEEEILT